MIFQRGRAKHQPVEILQPERWIRIQKVDRQGPSICTEPPSDASMDLLPSLPSIGWSTPLVTGMFFHALARPL